MTNDEQIDQLVATIDTMRRTIRACFLVIALGLPMIVGLLAVLVVQSNAIPARLDRVGNVIAAVRRDTIGLASHVDRYEGKLAGVEKTVEEIRGDTVRLAARLDRSERPKTP